MSPVAGGGAPAPADVTLARMAGLGLTLPPLRARAGRYVGHVRVGELLFLAGQGADGWVGRVGADLSMEQGRAAARDCAMNLLAQTADALDGRLDRVRRVVKVLGFVACTEDFTRCPQVLDGTSDLLAEVLGEERAAGGRSAVGVQALPLGFAVEVEMVLHVA